MPLYFAGSESTSTTEPTDSSSGSAAAMPLCTATPDVVCIPLQYAVALNATRAPGEGTAVVSRSTACRAAYRESSAVTSYSETNPHAATAVATLFRQTDSAMIMLMVSHHVMNAAATCHERERERICNNGKNQRAKK